MERDSQHSWSPAVCRDGVGLLSACNTACCALLRAGVVPAASMGGGQQCGWMDTLRVLWGGCWVPSCPLPKLKFGSSGKAEGMSCHKTLAVRAGLDDGIAGQHCLPRVRRGSPTSSRPTQRCPQHWEGSPTDRGSSCSQILNSVQNIK